MAVEEGAARVLRTSVGLKESEKVLILADVPCLGVGRSFFDAAVAMGADPVLAVIRPRGKAGTEPPEPLGTSMLEYDVILVATMESMTHTHARRAANRAGARIASMPGVTEAMLDGGALSVDHGELLQLLRRLERKLRHAKQVHIVSPQGTDLTFSVRGRDWITDDSGVCTKKGHFTTLPAGQLFVAPVEGTAEGRLIVDGLILEPVFAPVTIEVKKGYATRIVGAHRAVMEMNKGGREGRSLGKFGIGLNPRATTTGSAIEAEKALGTVHISFGDNLAFGGRTQCGVRVDAMIREASAEVDGKPLLDKGRIAS